MITWRTLRAFSSSPSWLIFFDEKLNFQHPIKLFLLLFIATHSGRTRMIPVQCVALYVHHKGITTATVATPLFCTKYASQKFATFLNRGLMVWSVSTINTHKIMSFHDVAIGTYCRSQVQLHVYKPSYQPWDFSFPKWILSTISCCELSLDKEHQFSHASTCMWCIYMWDWTKDFTAQKWPQKQSYLENIASFKTPLCYAYVSHVYLIGY